MTVTIDRRLATLLAALAGGAAGCKSLECGANTVEKDGQCVAEGQPAGLDCGPGTVYVKDTGRCESALFADGGGACGPNTVLITDENGIRTCVGTGGGANDCSKPLPCPAPSGQLVSMCGRVYDLEDTKPLDDGKADNGEPSRDIELRIYDPLAFIMNPTVKPLMKATPDSCGRFAIVNAPKPGSGFIALATDDVSDANGVPVASDTHILTAVAATVAGGDVLGNTRAFVLRKSTDTMWTQQAGLTGASFGTRGVYVSIYLGGATALDPFPAAPTANVMAAAVDTSGQRIVHAENDYYFDDTDPLLRKTVSASRSQTGPNGSALYINAEFGSFTGVGATPVGVCWRSSAAASPPGAAFVQERTMGAAFCQ